MARKGMFSGTGVAVETVLTQPNVVPGQAATGTTSISAPVAALVRSSLRAMSAGPLKTVGAILLAVALLGAGLWCYAAPAGAPTTPLALETALGNRYMPL